MWFSLTWRNGIRNRKTKEKMCVKQNERVFVDVAQQELAPLSAKLDQCLRLILRFLAIFLHRPSIYCDKYIVSITPYFFWCVCYSFVPNWSYIVNGKLSSFNLNIVSFFWLIQSKNLFDLSHWHLRNCALYKNRLFIKTVLFLNQVRTYCEWNIVGNV